MFILTHVVAGGRRNLPDVRCQVFKTAAEIDDVMLQIEEILGEIQDFIVLERGDDWLAAMLPNRCCLFWNTSEIDDAEVGLDHSSLLAGVGDSPLAQKCA